MTGRTNECGKSIFKTEQLSSLMTLGGVPSCAQNLSGLHEVCLSIFVNSFFLSGLFKKPMHFLFFLQQRAEAKPNFQVLFQKKTLLKNSLTKNTNLDF